MTRKKFIKQIMAMGYQRNEAERIAANARCCHWSYEEYLQMEKRYLHQQRQFDRAIENAKICLVECLAPVTKAAAEAMERLRKAVAAIEWKIPDLSGLFVTGCSAKNPHPCDALDALAYVAHHPVRYSPDNLTNPPKNLQIVTQAEHAALHGFNTNVVLVDELHGQDPSCLYGAAGGGKA